MALQQATFGDQLRHLREIVGLSQEELAERAGLTASGISALERGHRTHPYPHTVQMLASALELTGDERAAFVAAASSRNHERKEVGERGTSRPAGQRTPPLPVPLSPLIGRAHEVAVLTRMLGNHDVRLVSLTGPGGVGKTRLAIQVASVVDSDFADGIAWVDLSPFRDPYFVLPGIARAVGVTEIPGQSALESLRISLHPRHMLLLLDNFEQVVEAAPELVALLEGCPGLTALTTSRMTLRVRGEHEFPVRPLPVPEPQGALDPSALAQMDAVRLFLQRVQAVVPDFMLTAENAPTVAAICSRLDGLPLALELAGARLKYLAPQTLLDWLENRLDVLVDGARDLPARQQTLRNTLAWSHDLLTLSEQTLFRRLSVFVGGCTREAIESVCTAEDRPLDQMQRSLGSLVDKSMLQVRRGPSGMPRFVMLETIREYAQEQLAGSGEDAQVRQHHARYFLTLVEEAEPHLSSAGRGRWLEILEEDRHNVRAALEWSLAEGHDPELGIRLAGALSWYWYLRGRFSAGRWWLERACAEAERRDDPAARAKVLLGDGRLRYVQGDFAAARFRLEESVSLYRQAGDNAGIAHALTALAGATIAEGDWEQARSLCQESLSLSRAAGERWWEAFALHLLADAMRQLGDSRQAQFLGEQGLAIYQELGDRWGQAVALRQLGLQAASCSDWAAASRRYEQSMAFFRELDDHHGLGRALTVAAESAWQQSDNDSAQRLWREALTLWRDLGSATYTILCLGGLAIVASAHHDTERRACLFGAIATQLRAVGPSRFSAFATMFPTVYRAVFDPDALAAEAQLDDPVCRDAWEAGRTMSLEDAVSFALGE